MLCRRPKTQFGMTVRHLTWLQFVLGLPTTCECPGLRWLLKGRGLQHLGDGHCRLGI